MDKLPIRLLQIALAFAFLYAAVSAFLRPQDWIGYIPTNIKAIIPGETLLHIHSIFEVILSIWILSSWKLKLSTLVSFLFLIAITLANLSIFDVTFRDISLSLATLALFFLSK